MRNLTGNRGHVYPGEMQDKLDVAEQNFHTKEKISGSSSLEGNHWKNLAEENQREFLKS